MDLTTITTVGLGAAERVELARSVVGAFWTPAHGFDGAVIDDAERRLGLRFPSALRMSFEGLLASDGMNAQDRFVAPEHLDVTDGYMAFRVENQGCASWAVRTDGDSVDPLVWIKIGDSEWRDAGGRVSSFVVYAALCEAVFAPRHTANAPIDAGQLASVQAGFGRLDVEPFVFWSNPAGSNHFYAGPDTLIADHAGVWLWVACLSEESLERATGVIAADWLFS